MRCFIAKAYISKRRSKLSHINIMHIYFRWKIIRNCTTHTHTRARARASYLFEKHALLFAFKASVVRIFPQTAGALEYVCHAGHDGKRMDTFSIGSWCDQSRIKQQVYWLVGGLQLVNLETGRLQLCYTIVQTSIILEPQKARSFDISLSSVFSKSLDFVFLSRANRSKKDGRTDDRSRQWAREKGMCTRMNG